MVVPGFSPIPMLEVTTRFTRFEGPVTFRAFLPKIEAAFRVVTFVVDRFEVPVTFIFVAKRLTAFMIAALPRV